jgi:intein/homing endonuclease
MIQIVKSLLGNSDIEFYNELQIILSNENKAILSSDEQDVFSYLSKEFNNNKQFPTAEIFLSKFPQFRLQLDEFDAFSIADLRYYRKQFIKKHQNIYKSKILYKLASDAAVNGITPEMAEAVRKQASFESDVEDVTLSFREKYTKSMRENAGLKTFIEQIDDEIGYIPKGAMCTLAGFTGSFKCVSENERILTNRGMLTIKEIYNIGVNSDLMVQSEYGFKKLIAVHDEGHKDSYIISINGIPVETSPVHKFRVLTDNCELVWKEAKYLQIGDKIVQSLKESNHTGIDDDPDFWRLYGQMCGDGGHTSGTYYLCGACDTLDQIESERLFSKYFTKYSKTISAPRKHDHKSLFNLRAYNKYAIRDELRDFIGKTSKTKAFPNKLYYLSRECWKAFIIGLYETDGCSGNSNLGFTLSNKQFLVCLSRLLSGMGISSTLHHQKGDAYHLFITDAISRNRFIGIIKNVTFKANKNEIIDPIKYTNRPFPTRSQFLKIKNDKKLLLNRQDYKLFGRFGTSHSSCCFEKIKQVCKNYPVFLESDYFNEILSAELTWQPVTNIEQSSCYMYDLTVEGSPTYLLNGFVTHNTTWAVNMAVKNALLGKNIAYISLEITKEQLEYSILSLFSNDQRFSRMGYSPLEHQKIRQNKLTEDEINFLCDVLEPEYRRVIEPNFHILDGSKFKAFSESEIIDALYQIDDEKPIDGIFVDHVGELAFKSPLYNGNNVGAIINKYVSFFGALTVTFRKKDNEKRSVSTVLLAQTNRSGFKEAAASFRKLNMINRPGKDNQQINTQIEGYRLTALSDSNELERFSSIVMTVFANDDMKNSHQAYVQVLKTRYGSNIPPTPVDIEPEVYKFGGDATVNESELSVDLIDSLSNCVIAQKPAGSSIVIDSDDIFGL